MGSRNIIEINDYNFEDEVVAYSSNAPVLIYFWAEWSKASKEMKSVTEEITSSAGGWMRLAYLNIDTNPVLSAKFLIHTLPTLKVFFQEQVIKELIGWHTETQIINMLKSISYPDPDELLLEKGTALYNLGKFEESKTIFENILEKHPDSSEAQYYDCLCLIRTGKGEETLDTLRNFPASRWYPSSQKLIPLIKEIINYKLGKIEGDKDIDILYKAALKFISEGKIYLAIDGMMEVMRADRNYKNDISHATLLGMIEVLSDTDPQKRAYQSELASILF